MFFNFKSWAHSIRNSLSLSEFTERVTFETWEYIFFKIANNNLRLCCRPATRRNQVADAKEQIILPDTKLKVMQRQEGQDHHTDVRAGRSGCSHNTREAPREDEEASRKQAAGVKEKAHPRNLRRKFRQHPWSWREDKEASRKQTAESKEKT